MQKHRQIMLAGDLELRVIEPLLARNHLGATQFRHKEIETNFSNGHKTRVMQRTLAKFAQGVQILGLSMRYKNRMNAQRIEPAGQPLG